MLEGKLNPITNFLVKKDFMSSDQRNLPYYRVVDSEGYNRQNIKKALRTPEQEKTWNYNDYTPYDTVEFYKPEITLKGFRAVEFGLTAVALAEMWLLSIL